ncbi:ASB5 [Branchiostoma lanceolatum]|uniref:ASB5 protein n=1 Tax=Branchiostoma lanceolatum TaxID=7740 RepID=A0A8J9Z210_BRALA|nr:ASB5 [Branchiostoma lanceolatum]
MACQHKSCCTTHHTLLSGVVNTEGGMRTLPQEELNSLLKQVVVDRCVPCVRQVLLAGADPNVSMKQDMWYPVETPLHGAARDNRVDLIQLLIAFGADIHLLSGTRRTPKELAITGSEVQNLLVLNESEPHTLLHQCRQKVHLVLGRRRLYRLTNLDVPIGLKDYLYGK